MDGQMSGQTDEWKDILYCHLGGVEPVACSHMGCAQLRPCKQYFIADLKLYFKKKSDTIYIFFNVLVFYCGLF